MSEIKKLTADIDVGEYYEKYVDFEEVSKLCIEEEEMLGYNWNYPPFEFDVDEVWNSYNKLKIIAFKIDFSEEELAHTFEEKELDSVGLPNSISRISDYCFSESHRRRNGSRWRGR